MSGAARAAGGPAWRRRGGGQRPGGWHFAVGETKEPGRGGRRRRHHSRKSSARGRLLLYERPAPRSLFLGGKYENRFETGGGGSDGAQFVFLNPAAV